MAHRTRTRLAASTLAALLVLAGCGGDDGGDEADETTTTEEAEESTTTEAEDDPADTSEADEADDTTPEDVDQESAEALLESLLLTAAEVSPELGDGERPDDDADPPCGIDPDDDYPPLAKVGTLIGSDALSLYMVEDIRGYASTEDAEAAYLLAQDAFGCGADTDDPSVELGEVEDLTDVVGYDAFGLPAEVDGTPATLIVVLLSDLVISFQFQGDGDAAAQAGIPDSTTIASQGVDKVDAGL